MPCFSTVTNTKMTDATRLADAMRAAGIEDVRIEGNTVHGRGLSFYRRAKGDAFSTRSYDSDLVEKVGKRYAKASVRAWAKRTGFSIVDTDGDTITLRNRRG